MTVWRWIGVVIGVAIVAGAVAGGVFLIRLRGARIADPKGYFKADPLGPNVIAQVKRPAESIAKGTESQRAFDLLNREFRTQSGDVDMIVFHVSHGTIDSPAVRAAMDAAAQNFVPDSKSSPSASTSSARYAVKG